MNVVRRQLLRTAGIGLTSALAGCASGTGGRGTSMGAETTSHTFDSGGVSDVYCTYHGSPSLTGMSTKVGVGDAAIEEPLGSSDGGAY